MINEKDVKKYCYEDLRLIENYELATSDTKMWYCHHRVETIMNCGKKELIAQGCYENRPAHDLIFLTKSAHSSLHAQGQNNPFFGQHHSAEAKAKISAANKGENNPLFGQHHSEATKAKIAESQRSRWQKWRQEHGRV